MGNGTTVLPWRYLLRIVSDTSFRADFIVKLNYCMALVDCSAMSIIARKVEHSSFPQATMHVAAKACQEEDRRCLKRRNTAGCFTQQLDLHPLRSRNANSWDAVMRWGEQKEPYVSCSWEACPCHPHTQKWRMGYGDSLLRETQHSFAKQTNHPTAHLLQGQNLRYYHILIKAHPGLATLCMCPCG